MNLLEMIGETPLIALPSFSAELSGVTLLAKVEFMNPSGSVEGRAAKAMVLDGVVWGLSAPDKTIIDVTSGNTGITCTMIGAVLGYHIRLYLSQNTNPERKKIICQHGATTVGANPFEGSDGAYLKVQAQVAAHPKRYFYPDRYNNLVNPQICFATVGKEIWR